MKKLLIPVWLGLVFQCQMSLADVDSDCALLEKAVVEFGQKVDSLESQYRLARISGDGNMKNIRIQLEKVIDLQNELERELAQCQASE